MGLRCGVCRHQDRATIERRIAAGDSDSAIAKDYPPMQQTSVAVHRAKHMTALSAVRMDPAEKKAILSELQTVFLAHKVNRISELQDIRDRLRATIVDRANDAKRRKAAIQNYRETGQQMDEDGRDVKGVGYAPHVGAEHGLLGPDGELDVYIVRELRSTLEQAAKELGEWDITGAGSRDKGDGGTGVIINQVVNQLVTGADVQAIPSVDPRPGATARAQLPAPALQIPVIDVVTASDSLGSDDK